MNSRRRSLEVVRLATDELPRGPWSWARSVRIDAPAPPDGELVEVLDASERFVGHALYNGSSDIRLRWLSRGRRKALERPREFLLGRLKRADDLRRRTLRLGEVTDAYRIAHAEGDDLPGLIVDRLAGVIVCEYHALGFWRLREEVDWALGQLYPDLARIHTMPERAARSEGLDGAPPIEPEEPPFDPERGVVVQEHGLRFPVVPAGRHKTGWFCDQRDNRRDIGELSEGRTVLDLFCNTAGFALHAARAGARRVQAVDIDEGALARAEGAAELNNLSLELVHADAFDHLRELKAQGTAFDIVIVDPHKLIRGRADQEAGLRKYADINALALGCVRSGGLLATFSCSGALELGGFLGTVFGAGRRAERELRLLDVMGAAHDHPQHPDWSRSRYLKGALLAVD